MSTINANKEEEEEAVKIYATANESTKKALEELFGASTFKARPKTVAEALKNIALPDFTVLAPDSAAFIKLKHLISTLNEGWVPDWTNENQPKYQLYFDMNPFSLGIVYVNFVFVASSVPSRLCFRDRETADYFVSVPEFLELYKIYMLG